jgi:hypothetical protein
VIAKVEFRFLRIPAEFDLAHRLTTVAPFCSYAKLRLGIPALHPAQQIIDGAESFYRACENLFAYARMAIPRRPKNWNRSFPAFPLPAEIQVR